MKKIIYINFILLIISFYLSSVKVYSQDRIKVFTNEFNNALVWMNYHEYEQSLHLFLGLDTITSSDLFSNYKGDSYQKDYETIQRIKTQIKFHIAECYLGMENEKIKAIPYLEDYIAQSGRNVMPVVYKYLGSLYHLNYQFDKAIDSFEKYCSETQGIGRDLPYCKRMIEICKYAQAHVPRKPNNNDSRIQNIGYIINTRDTEKDPLITADDSSLYYTFIKYFENNRSLDSTKQILVSRKLAGRWQSPEVIDLNFPVSQADVSLVGITPDGEKLIIRHTIEDTVSNLYLCELTNNKCVNYTELKSINSPFIERSATISADGNEMFFSSNRPKNGGSKPADFDIYKATRKEDGKWSDPVNIGSPINTGYDEDAPFIHPNNKYLFFCSNGHNTIGGFDIFKAIRRDGKWTNVENLGFPINTPLDNMYFTLSASGQTGYFAASQYDRLNNKNIYSVNYKENIPLTLIKGTIVSAKTNQPIAAKIHVIDRETNTPVKYAYTPNTQTGKYLMIVPPGKFYNIVFEASGYLPQTITVRIPNQTYFYQLFQEIRLDSANILGQAGYESIRIRNTFYDILNSQNKNYSKLQQLITDIVNTTDSIGLEDGNKIYKLSDDEADAPISSGYELLKDLVERAIITNDTEFFEILKHATPQDEVYKQAYFYAAGEKQKGLERIQFNGKTAYSAPPVRAFPDKRQISDLARLIYAKRNTARTVAETSEKTDKKQLYKNKRLILTYRITFDTNNWIIKEGFYNGLHRIAELLVDNKNLKLEIDAYSNNVEEQKPHRILKDKRANEALNFLNKQGVDIDGIKTNAFWEKSDDKDDKPELRRIDIKVYYLPTSYTI